MPPPDPPDLSDRLVVVTGASRGLGAALARDAAGAGARVALCGRGGEALEAVAAAIRDAGGRAEPRALDVADAAAVDAWASDLTRRHGPVHGLVTNAGLLGPRIPLARITAREWSEVLRVNVDGVFHCVRSFLPALRATRGSVVGVSSGVVGEAREAWGAYAVSKEASDALIRNLAAEEEVRGVRANLVDPGKVRTGMRAAAYPDEDPEEVPPPEAITGVFLWLLSEASRPVTGRRFDALGPEGREREPGGP